VVCALLSLALTLAGEPLDQAAEPATPPEPLELKLSASTLNAYSPALILLDAELVGGADDDPRLKCPKLKWELSGQKRRDVTQRTYTQEDAFWDRAATVHPGGSGSIRRRERLSTVTRRPKCDGQAEAEATIPRLFHHELNLTESGDYWIQVTMVGTDGLELRSNELPLRVHPGIREP
jgi:hypothetical protein